MSTGGNRASRVPSSGKCDENSDLQSNGVNECESMYNT